MAQRNARGEIRAAGGIVVGGEGDVVRVLMVHRPRFDDWSIPKGKVKRGEEDSEAALREVHEETGLRCELGQEVGRMHYRDRKGRAKVARYWFMTAPTQDASPQHEVDRCEWIAIETATLRATRSGDRDFLAAVAAVLRRLPAGRRRPLEIDEPLVVYEED